MKQGPEPSVINWENLNVGKFQRFLRTVAVVIITIVLIAVSIMGIVYSQFYQDKASKQYSVS